jgi:hypothetical protein
MQGHLHLQTRKTFGNSAETSLQLICERLPLTMTRHGV